MSWDKTSVHTETHHTFLCHSFQRSEQVSQVDIVSPPHLLPSGHFWNSCFTSTLRTLCSGFPLLYFFLNYNPIWRRIPGELRTPVLYSLWRNCEGHTKMQTPDNTFQPCSWCGFEYSSLELWAETSLLKFWCGIHVGNKMEPCFLPCVSCAQYPMEIHTINNQALTTESRWNLSLIPDHHGVRNLLPSFTCSLISRHKSTSVNMWPSRKQSPSFCKTQFTCSTFQGDSRDVAHTQRLLCVMDTQDYQIHTLTAG
jgi:hypothetical protein